MSENVHLAGSLAPKNMAIFTGTTLKPWFYDCRQPQKPMKEKGEGREEEGLFTLIILMLPTLVKPPVQKP